MIAVVLRAPSNPDHPDPARRGTVVHALADTWPGPRCNNGVPRTEQLVTGAIVEDAERVTCWACRTLLAGGDPADPAAPARPGGDR